MLADMPPGIYSSFLLNYFFGFIFFEFGVIIIIVVSFDE